MALGGSPRGSTESAPNQPCLAPADRVPGRPVGNGHERKRGKKGNLRSHDSAAFHNRDAAHGDSETSFYDHHNYAFQTDDDSFPLHSSDAESLSIGASFHGYSAAARDTKRLDTEQGTSRPSHPHFDYRLKRLADIRSSHGRGPWHGFAWCGRDSATPEPPSPAEPKRSSSQIRLKVHKRPGSFGRPRNYRHTRGSRGRRGMTHSLLLSGRDDMKMARCLGGRVPLLVVLHCALRAGERAAPA